MSVNWCGSRNSPMISSDRIGEKSFFVSKKPSTRYLTPYSKCFLDFQEAGTELNRQDGSFTANIHQRERGIKCSYGGRFSIGEHYVYAYTLLPQKDSVKTESECRLVR